LGKYSMKSSMIHTILYLNLFNLEDAPLSLSSLHPTAPHSSLHTPGVH
jgi:hypothetical protein